MIRAPSAKRRERSPGVPRSIPYALCSAAFQAAPMPRIARPFEMWSSVVAMFASTAGFRCVMPETRHPTRTFCVIAAYAGCSCQPSKFGRCVSPLIA